VRWRSSRRGREHGAEGAPPANRRPWARWCKGWGPPRKASASARSFSSVRPSHRSQPLGGALQPGHRPRERRRSGHGRGRAEAAHKLAPEMQDVVVALAEVERRRGQHKDAAELLTDFVNAHPLPSKLARCSWARCATRAVEKAIVQAREVLVRKPGDAQALAELALCHLAKARRTRPSCWPSSHGREPEERLAHAQGSSTWRRATTRSRSRSSQATQEDPRDTTARLNMGSVLLRGRLREGRGSVPRHSSSLRRRHRRTVGLAAAIRAQADASRQRA